MCWPRDCEHATPRATLSESGGNPALTYVVVASSIFIVAGMCMNGLSDRQLLTLPGATGKLAPQSDAGSCVCPRLQLNSTQKPGSTL